VQEGLTTKTPMSTWGM